MRLLMDSLLAGNAGGLPDGADPFQVDPGPPLQSIVHSPWLLTSHPRSLNESCDVFWILMLPVTKHRPTFSAQCECGLEIARAIAGQLWLPVVGIGPWSGAVLRARMPKAPIDENCDPPSCEQDISSGPHYWRGAGIDQVSESGRVEEPTDPQLRFCVARTVATHGPLGSFVDRP